jgi:O-antigen ligase
MLIFTCISAAAGLYFSFSRGAMLGLLASLPVLVFFQKRQYFKLVLGGAAIAIGSMVLISITGGFEGNRFFKSFYSETNIKRFSMYQASLYAFIENPLVGLGSVQFSENVSEIKERYGLPFRDFHQHAHNVFLEILADFGTLGFLLFMGWLIAWIFELKAINDKWSRLLYPFLVCFIVSGQFEYLFDSNNTYLIFTIYAFSQAHILIQRNELNPRANKI